MRLPYGACQLTRCHPAEMMRFPTRAGHGWMINLRRINLNLLVTLDALLQARSATAAAESLGLTQSAVSSALAKLRDIFEDELLVLVGRELRLTPRAERLQTQLKDVLQSVELLLDKEHFDPATWEGDFVIGTADYMSVILLPHLLEVTSRAAPGMTIRFTNLNRDAALNLKLDAIDMIIAPMPLVRDPMLMSRHIFSDRWLCAFRADGRFGEAGVSLDDYLAGTHACSLLDRIQYGGKNDTRVPEVDGLRAQQNNAVLLPFYSALPFIVAQTDLFALIQQRLVDSLHGVLPIATCPPPVSLPDLEYAMFWSPRMSRNPAHMWMRRTISEVTQRHFPDLAPL